MPKPKKRKSFVNVRVKFADQLPVVAEQPASSTSEVVMLAGVGVILAHISRLLVDKAWSCGKPFGTRPVD